MGEVKNYYFEFSDQIVSMKLAPSKHCTYRGQNLDHVREHVWNAQRIWIETDGTVYYTKHRMGSLETLVDTKEFMWIKLSAQDIK